MSYFGLSRPAARLLLLWQTEHGNVDPPTTEWIDEMHDALDELEPGDEIAAERPAAPRGCPGCGDPSPLHELKNRTPACP